ncbi:MAG: DUF2945 domain-containing protein [Cyanosarcina radialis HA8281-LM2]|jgi:hypothetical protein|nr:DUF2945 domain-containing protein [Cyanosarcina radialis HA8281-LM2]
MSEQFKKGDPMEWDSSGGTSRGVIKEIVTEPTDFKNHHFAASKERPEYLVESDKSGKQAIHRAEELRKVEEK